jgi:hypothetical protein
MAVPTGDELNFAGEEGFVFAPNIIVDLHRSPVSAALNVGARLRTEQAKLADLTVGHQMTAGLGVTGHLLDRRFLLSAEGALVAEMDGFDRIGFEYRASVGYIPDQARDLTLWISGGSAAGTGDLLGTPQFRFLLGLTYAPKPEEDAVEPETMPEPEAVPEPTAEEPPSLDDVAAPEETAATTEPDAPVDPAASPTPAPVPEPSPY